MYSAFALGAPLNGDVRLLEMRDEFSLEVKQALGMRVALLCSNPKCRRNTAGPRSDPHSTLNLGVAAHITAASPRGPRFDPGLIASQRQSAENGIWLCQNCAKLIDSDVTRFDVDLLRQWRHDAERTAREALESSTAALRLSDSACQSSNILSYARSFELLEPDQSTLRDIGRQLHRLVAYAFLDTCASTPFDRFVYVSSLVLDPLKGEQPRKTALSVFIACHISRFVAAYQELVETLFDRTDEEYLQRTAAYPEDLKIRLSYAWRTFVPYEISRTGPKQVAIRYVDNTFFSSRSPMTTSDLLVLLSAMHAGHPVVYDDLKFSSQDVALLTYLHAAQDRGTFSLADFVVEKANPETWALSRSAITGLRGLKGPG